ncbi:hypothetical protein I4U23_014534 [Adineta vaga]|nr:hypothetical protein I4U23_014534 [Adineta vaga]
MTIATNVFVRVVSSKQVPINLDEESVKVCLKIPEHICGDGTTPDTLGIECVCKPGLYEIGHDRIGRRVCGECKGPYHTFNADKRCIWSCTRGAVPNPLGTDCIY